MHVGIDCLSDVFVLIHISYGFNECTILLYEGGKLRNYAHAEKKVDYEELPISQVHCVYLYKWG